MCQDRSFCKPMSRETEFLTWPERQKTPTTRENTARGKHVCITNDNGRNTETNRLRRLRRVSAVCGRLRSIRARRRTGSYQLLVDSGAAINLIKEKILDKQDIRQKNFKEHKIVLKTWKAINLRLHKLPKKHREFEFQETEKLLNRGIIRES